MLGPAAAGRGHVPAFPVAGTRNLPTHQEPSYAPGTFLRTRNLPTHQEPSNGTGPARSGPPISLSPRPRALAGPRRTSQGGSRAAGRMCVLDRVKEGLHAKGVCPHRPQQGLSAQTPAGHISQMNERQGKEEALFEHVGTAAARGRTAVPSPLPSHGRCRVPSLPFLFC